MTILLISSEWFHNKIHSRTDAVNQFVHMLTDVCISALYEHVSPSTPSSSSKQS